MHRVKEPIYLFTGVMIALFVGVVTCNLSKREVQSPVEVIEELPVTSYHEPLEVDPYPVTENVDPALVQRAKLIGRLTNGILKISRNEDGILWVECGKRYTEEEAKEVALEWAFFIEKGSSLYGVNPWGVMGTIYNESKFDRCSLGKFPKAHAEKKGYIKKNRLHLSRDKTEILNYLESKDCKNMFPSKKIDLGPMQVLALFIDLPLEEQLTLDPGLLHQIAEMRSRESYPGCRGRPWACWRGSHKQWYDNKVIRYAKRMGAKEGEI